MKIKSIRTPMYLVTMAALVLTALAISSADIFMFQRAYRSALSDRAITVAHNLRDTVHRNLVFFPLAQFTGMDSYLESIVAANDGIHYIFISSGEGQVLYHSTNMEGQRQLNAERYAQVRFESSADRTTLALSEDYESIVPIFWEDAQVGWIHVGVAKTLVDQRTSMMWGTSVGLLVLALGLAALPLYSVLKNRIAAPLAHLTSTAQAIAAGDLTQSVDIDREDEIGALARAFNQMTSELQLSYQRLSEREAYFRSLIENAQDIITVHDLRGWIIYQSASVQRVLGYEPDELIDRDLTEMLDPADVKRVQEVFSQTAQDEGIDRAIEFRFKHKDGSWRYLEATGRRLEAAASQPGIVVNSRDITERKQREREQAAMIAVASVVRSATNRSEIISIVLDEVQKLMRAEGALLGMREAVSGETIVVLGVGQWSRTQGLRIAPNEGVSGAVMAAGEPYLCANASDDPRHVHLEACGDLNSVACVPLMVQGQALGVLWVGSRQPFTEAELHLLTAVTDIAANAIHRATLNEQTEQRLFRLDALRKIDQVITGSFDVRISLDAIVKEVIARLGADASDILLLNPHTHMLEYAAGWGFHTKAIQRTRLHANEGFAGKAVLERRIVRLDDPGREVDFLRGPALSGEGFVQYLGAPLIAKGRVKGVLEVFHRSAFRPDPDWLDFLETLAGQAAIAIDNAELFEDLQRSNLELILAYDTTLEGWSHALDLRDRETEGHTQRVTDLSEQLARALGVQGEELVHIRRGALLHDIGKMAIPDEILLKNGPLSEQEWQIMRLHPVFAYELLSPIQFLRHALDIPYCHHERWNGSGYPRGLVGTQIPLAARLFAVVDVWDALLSNRPYRQAWDEEEADHYLRTQAGELFDPQVVDVFFKEILRK
jgi:PAS domain S-box-containing protein/putative nucleotidyltransferase with HDIG domain